MGHRMVESRVTGHARVSSSGKINEHRRHGHRDRSVLSRQACPVIERRKREHGYRMVESRVTGHARVSEINEHCRHGHRDRSVEHAESRDMLG